MENSIKLYRVTISLARNDVVWRSYCANVWAANSTHAILLTAQQMAGPVTKWFIINQARAMLIADVINGEGSTAKVEIIPGIYPSNSVLLPAPSVRRSIVEILLNKLSKFIRIWSESMKIEDIDIFTRHYLIAALWSSCGHNGEPLDLKYSLEDIHPATVQKAYYDCSNFQYVNGRVLRQAYEFYVHNGLAAHPDAGSPEACAGHDFWLTRNRHGAGFRDHGMGILGIDLAVACLTYAEVDLYVGDDGKIHGL